VTPATVSPVDIHPITDAPGATAATDVSTRRVPGWQLVLRLFVIMVIIGWEALRTLSTVLVVLIIRGRSRARKARYHGVVRALQTLGPTFVKFGQISSTRRDTMSAEMAEEMGALHDAVRPMSWRKAEKALEAARAAQPRLNLSSVDREPVASGSIACVYRAVMGDGTVVALKLKRPGIDERMRADLALVQIMTRFAQRMPKMKGMPMADLVGYISRAILGQLDFAREARNVEALRCGVAGMPDVRIPVLHSKLSAPNCLVFEFLPDLDARTPQTLPAQVRARLASAALAATHKLFFVEGFVHCDLHPGNLYLTRDGTLVILDAGYCVQLPPRVRELIGEFFARMALGDGRRCGEIVLESAVNLTPETNTGSFIEGMSELVATHAGPGRRFDMEVFGNAVFELEQKHGIYAASDFAFPLMSLLVLEGTVRGLWPEVDFQQVGVA
jgi:ubiquinone biosynthesis protein